MRRFGVKQDKSEINAENIPYLKQVSKPLVRIPKSIQYALFTLNKPKQRNPKKENVCKFPKIKIKSSYNIMSTKLHKSKLSLPSIPTTDVYQEYSCNISSNNKHNAMKKQKYSLDNETAVNTIQRVQL